MYCGKCGSELDDDAAFCPECGAKTARTDTTAVEATPASVPAQPNTTAPAANAGDPKKKRTGLIIAIAAAVVVVIAIVGIAIWFVNDQNMQAKRTPHPVSFTIQAQSYDDQCTKIPVSIKGSDFEGKQVDDVAFIDASGSGIELVKGEYELSFPASPLTPDGVLYTTPPGSWHVSLGEELEEGADAGQVSQEPIVFNKSTALDETDEMIKAAYEYAVMDESQADKAAQLKEVAERTHADAEEAHKAAEAKAMKQQAGRYYECPYYTIDLPDSFDPSCRIDSSSAGPMNYQPNAPYRMGLGYEVTIRNGSGNQLHVCVYTVKWGPEGDLDSRDLGYANDGCDVWIYAANDALFDQLGQFITLRH
ncbi:MAG: zinc ribbon domain-containing protein [Coriobacteriales bacterium]